MATPQVPRARADEGHCRLHERGLPHLGQADTHRQPAQVCLSDIKSFLADTD